MATALQIRRKIDTVGTIKQTADAMRIVAMSSHTRLKREKEALDIYRAEVARICSLVYTTHSPTSPSRRTASSNSPSMRSKRLVIVVGTQKGLCGNFNNELLRFFQKSHPLATLNNILGKTLDLILIGRQIVNLFEHHGIKATKTFPLFAPNNLDELSELLLQEIHDNDYYHEATVFSNYPETFFLQKPRVTTLFERDAAALEPNPASLYTYEQSYSELAQGLAHLNEQTHIRSLLFHSLLAEQAARFISMDSASMSADKMLSQMRMSYNKMRQAAITLELQDLMSGSL